MHTPAALGEHESTTFIGSNGSSVNEQGDAVGADSTRSTALHQWLTHRFVCCPIQ